MNQNFRYRFDQMKSSDPTEKELSPDQDDKTERYSRESNVRNVCFIMSDGKRYSFNYSYLVSTEYDPEQGTIILSFTSHIITLVGIYLEGLHSELFDHIPRIIVCQDERYNMLDEKKIPVVNAITITGN